MPSHDFPPPNDALPATGERYVPAAVDKVQQEHYHRYLWALPFCRGKSVVDVASGEGYGAAVIASVAESVLGFDNSAEAIGSAVARYSSHTNLWFKVADAHRLPIEDDTADVVLSFETIEHVEQQREFVAELARIVRPDGLVILSTPDRNIYLGGSGSNEFHVHELSREELEELLAAHFAEVAVGGQRSDPASLIGFAGDSAPLYFAREEGETFAEAGTEIPAPVYLLAVASHAPLPPIPAQSALFDSEFLPSLHDAYRQALTESWEAAQAAGSDAERGRERAEQERERAEQLEAELGRLSAVVAERDRAVAAAAESRRDLARLESELTVLRSEQGRLAAAEKRSELLAWELSVVRADLERVASSISWRLTSPLRMTKAVVTRQGRAMPGGIRGWLRGRIYRRLARTRFADVVRRRIRRNARQPYLPRAKELLVVPPEELAPDDYKLVESVNGWVQRARSVRDAAALEYTPLISFLMPTYNTPPDLLRAAVESMLSQSYAHWELVIADDGSTSLDAQLDEIVGWDPRIRVVKLGTNSGISAATNIALENATGEYVAMVDHDDLVLPDALLDIVRVLNDDPDTDAVYTDQEYGTASGDPEEPHFKPDWDPYLFRGVMYIGHLLAVRRSIAVAVGGFDSTFDNVQDFDFMLRVSETTDRIAHVPRIHYRWRRIPGSVAHHGDEKAGIPELQARAVTAHLGRLGIPAHARPHPTLAHRAQIFPDAQSLPPVTLVVGPADRDGEEAADEGRGLPDGSHVVVWGRSPTAECGTLVEAVELAAHETLVFLDPTLAPDDDEWLSQLSFYAGLADVAAASGVSLAADGTVQASGWVVGADGVSPAFAGWDGSSDGYAGSLSCARTVAAIDGRCAAITAATLAALGGFRPHFESAVAAWLDLSLRATDAGLKSIVSPLARFRSGHAFVGFDGADRQFLSERWARRFDQGDPYHNPNLFQPAGGQGAK